MGLFLFVSVILVIAILAVNGKNKKLQQQWLSWPTLEQYWSQHAECKTNNGVKCYKCGSRYTRHLGWTVRSDTRRIHSCNQCSTTLYRTGG